MKRLMLVDDEHNVVSALKRVLRASLAGDVRIECFTDPTVALARIQEVSFDVILSDYRMPQMNGIEFLRAACKVQPHLVRMILSATSDFEIVQQAINEIEIYRYLAKPWTEIELVKHVGGALDRSEQTRTDRQLADSMRVQQGKLSVADQEMRRLEELEPGLTVVEWGPHGEVLMPDELLVFDQELRSSK